MEAEQALKRGNTLIEGTGGGLLKGLLYGVTVMEGGRWRRLQAFYTACTMHEPINDTKMQNERLVHVWLKTLHADGDTNLQQKH